MNKKLLSSNQIKLLNPKSLKKLAKKFNQKEIAKMCGVSLSVISRRWQEIKKKLN